MGRVLALGVEQTAVDALRAELGPVSDVHVVERAALEAASHAADLETVVVGPSADPVRHVQRAHSLAPGAPIVVVAPPEEIEGIRESLRFAVLVGDRVRCVSAGEPLELAEHVRDAIEHGRAAVRTRRALDRMNERVKDMHPPARIRPTEVLGKVLAYAPVGVVLLDAEGRVRTVNREAAQLLARPEAELAGAALGDSIAAADRSRWQALFEARMPGGVARDTLHIGEEGDLVAEVAVTRLVGERADGGHLAILHDVTERTRLVLELSEASRRKDEFLAMLSHELRNPLSPILTAAQLLRLRGGAGAPREVATIERQVRHLAALLDDLLDVSRITRGRIKLSRTRFELDEAVLHAVETMTPLLQEREHRLVVDVPTEGLPVWADLHRVTQIVGNLLSNAAKYTEPGGTVTVTAKRQDGAVALSVRDSGAGIPPRKLSSIFEPFVQQEQSLDRQDGGLGLGLTVVSNLVALHGGSITVDSQPGAGSEFLVTLPLATEDAPQAGAEGDPDHDHDPELDVPFDAAAPEGGGRVLVVDDNRDAAEALAAVLEAGGLEWRIAADGPSGLAAAAELEPDVALVDIGLPGMDGHELARRLRERHPGIRLLAITGYGRQIDRDRAAQAGFDEHLVKPVDLATLLAILYPEGSRGRA